jgi:tetratricopeptide (TPR) repeat protein
MLICNRQKHAGILSQLLLTCAVLLAGCNRVDVSNLPAVPQVRVDDFLPGVQAQLSEAYAQVEKSPASVEANGHLAMLLQTYKQFVAAQTMYARTRMLEPDRFQWAYLHGIVLSAVGRPDDAITAFRHALTLTDDYPMASIRLAELLAETGETLEAAQLYDDVIANSGPLSEAFFSHGRFLLRQGQVDQAILAFNETLRLSGNLGAAHYQLGLAYRAKGRVEQAQHHLALAKKHEGYSADSNDRVLNQLLPLNMSDTPFVHRAKVLAESGRIDEAQRFIQMALERNPRSVAAHASMIGMAASRGDFAAVDQHFATAVAIEPANAKLYFNLGMARIAERRYVEAVNAFESSIERDATDPNAHVQLAILRHKNKMLSSARRHLRQALDLEPLHPTANWLLGEMLFEDGAAAAAQPLLQRAVAQESPLRPLMYALLAEVQLELGDAIAATQSVGLARQDLRNSTDPSMRKRVDAVAQRVATASSADPEAD